MTAERRAVLAAVGTLLAAGCTSTGGGEPTEGTTTQPRNDTPTCDPADVTRPPVASGTNIEGRAYPQKPDPLTEESILFYLDDFETAFAWNRVLQTATVTSVGVDNLDGFSPNETGDGFIASSGIRVTYTTEDGENVENAYVANYFVSPGPVYRYESRIDEGTPTSQEETQLVQCGTDGKSE